jgi:hypothetical protein
MNDIWEEVWDTVSETFQRLAASLNTRYPKMAWSSGHSDNKVFPFRAYATFNRRSPGSEDVVVSIDFHKSEDKLRYSADIGRDDGTVIADGPTGTIAISGGLGSATAEIRTAIGSIVQFMEANEQLVSDAINQ